MAVGAPSISARHSIRTALTAPIAGLSLILLATLGYFAAGQWSEYRQVSAMQEFDAGANKFITGLFEVLMERLATNNGLQAPPPASADVLKEIERRRAAVAQNFDAGVKILEGFAFPNQAVLLKDLNSALDAANKARRQADEALKLPRDNRDENLRKNFIPIITASVNSAVKVWFAALHHAAAEDPVLARLATIKEIGWRMRDIAGTERSNIAAAISAGSAIPADKLAANAEIRSRVDLLWQQLENLTADSAVDPKIKQAIAGAKADYFQAFRGLADQMRKVSDEAGKYPIDNARWVDTTTPQLGTLLQVMYAAGEASEARTQSLRQGAIWTLAVQIGLLVLGMMAAASATLIVSRRVAAPLVALAPLMDRLAQGDTSVAIPNAQRGDEIGAMAKTVQVFKEALIAKREAEETALREMNSKTGRAQMLDDLTKRFESNVASLTRALSSSAAEMEATAQTMTATADQTADKSVGVASAAEQTAANVQAVAVATEELSASIREIAEQVGKSSSIAGRASEEAKRTNQTVQTLAAAAQKIGDVVSLINNIAGQTNLLALNATIEAARAGEAGRGFAVVASEVKELASQTAKATEEIAAQIGGIQEETKNAVVAIHTIGTTIDEMNAIAAGVAAAMEEQGAATQEIARSVQQASAGTHLVTGNILDVKRGAGDTGSAAAQVLVAAQELARHSEDLGREVDSFLSGVKAA